MEKKSYLLTNRILITFNRLLSVVLFVASAYLVVYPLIPELLFVIQQNSPQTTAFSYDNLEAETLVVREEIIDEDTGEKTEVERTVRIDKLVTIPKIGVEGPVLTGDSANLLNLGFWHRPNSSTPGQGGNTVITGHRFLYQSGPKTFYHLDKVNNGDQISVYWEGTSYNYEVFNIQEVTPDQVEIEENTEESIITLYTCTPLWTAERRLVIQARLIGSN